MGILRTAAVGYAVKHQRDKKHEKEMAQHNANNNNNNNNNNAPLPQPQQQYAPAYVQPWGHYMSAGGYSAERFMGPRLGYRGAPVVMAPQQVAPPQPYQQPYQQPSYQQPYQERSFHDDTNSFVGPQQGVPRDTERVSPSRQAECSQDAAPPAYQEKRSSGSMT